MWYHWIKQPKVLCARNCNLYKMQSAGTTYPKKKKWQWHLMLCLAVFYVIVGCICHHLSSCREKDPRICCGSDPEAPATADSWNFLNMPKSGHPRRATIVWKQVESLNIQILQDDARVNFTALRKRELIILVYIRIWWCLFFDFSGWSAAQLVSSGIFAQTVSSLLEQCVIDWFWIFFNRAG